MSTQEPGGPQPEGGPPGYAQPQDPWAGGFDYGHGHASVPTDPHPQQYDPYETYGHEYATGHGDPWGSQTVRQGGPDWPGPPGQPTPPPAAPAPAPRSPAVPVLVALLVVVVLGAAAGAIYWFTSERPNVNNAGATPTPTVATTGPVGGVSTAFNPHRVTEGVCLSNEGTNKKPQMREVSCGTKGVFKVVQVAKGESLPENSAGKFDEYSGAQVCAGVPDYKNYYAFDAKDDKQDLIFCLSIVK